MLLLILSKILLYQKIVDFNLDERILEVLIQTRNEWPRLPIYNCFGF